MDQGEVMGQLKAGGGSGGGHGAAERRRWIRGKLREVKHHASRQAVSFGHGAGHTKNDISMFYRCKLSNP